MNDLAELHGVRQVRLIELAAQPGHRSDGPAVGGDVLAELRRAGVSARWHASTEGAPNGREGKRTAQHHLAEVCSAAASNGELPLLLSPDQAASASAWEGVARACGAAGSIGVIWIDSRLDALSPDAKPAPDDDRMALSRVLGVVEALDGEAFPAPDPAHVCVVAAHDWDASELERLTRLGVRMFGLSEVRRRGLDTVLCDALSVARGAPAGFVVSLDLAALGGGEIDARELAHGLHALRACPDLLGLEISRPAALPGWQAEFAAAALGPTAKQLRQAEDRYGAHNYDPLPVVFARGEGVWLWDVEGRRYLDMMSAYSAVSLGHAHPRLLQVLSAQAGRLALTSRAYSTDRLPLLLERLCSVFGYEAALPVNTGVEAVETALKAARKWAVEVKGVADGEAEIIACDGNFHGRTITVVGLSSEAQYREGFGPFPPGLLRVPYGDVEALAAAITPKTAAFLVEPIQGEGGICMPPAGWLKRCADLCRANNVLLIADEVQTGLGRTGKLLACAHEGVRPDGVILGKALGGGLLPVSAFLADRSVMNVFRPGDHGSTFGGNPLAAAVAVEALDILMEENLCEHSASAGERFRRDLAGIASPLVREVRGRGLFVGVDLDPERVDAHVAAERLLARGLMTKDTHHTVLRFAPPLIIEQAELDWAVDVVGDTLSRLA